jgi:hypothetical protein
MEVPGAAVDTQPGVERRVIEGLARMAPEERLARTMALCRAASELAIAGIRLREGELPAAEVRLRLACLRYGTKLVERAEAHRLRHAG